MIIAVKAAKKESHGGGRHGVVLDVCRLFRGDIGNNPQKQIEQAL